METEKSPHRTALEQWSIRATHEVISAELGAMSFTHFPHIKRIVSGTDYTSVMFLHKHITSKFRYSKNEILISSTNEDVVRIRLKSINIR